MMRIKEVTVGETAVAGGRCKRGAAQHQLVDHEFAIVLAECALNGLVTGVGGVRAAGPLPYDPERVVEMPAAGGDFPFHFGRQMLAAPPRKGVRLIITDVANRSGRIEGLRASQGHDLPFAVDLAPVAGRNPSFVAECRKPVHEPERGLGVAAVFHEGEPLSVSDEIARQLHRADQRTMRGFFVVEMKAVVALSDSMNPLVEHDPALTGSR